MTIFTIEYEGVTSAAFVATLHAAGVTRVIDVRALPLSRRPGFSKTMLAATLREAGIDYVHLKALGTAEMPSALLCYERDPCHCHRTLLLAAVAEGREVIDLFA